MSEVINSRIIKQITDERAVFAVFLFGHMFSFIFPYIGSAAEKILIDAFYIWVILVYLFHTVITGKYRNTKTQKTAQLFFAVILVSTLLQKANYYLSIIGSFSILLLYLFIAPASCNDDYEDRFLDQITLMLLIYVFIMSLISVVAITMNTPFIQSISDNRVRGYYSNSNYAGMFCNISIGSMYYWKKKGNLLGKLKYSKILGSVNLLIQGIMLIYAQSRTSQICTLILFLGMFLETPLYQSIRQKAGKSFKKYIIFSALIIIFVLLFTPIGLPRNIYYYLSPNAIWSDNPEYQTVLGRINYMTSNRLYLWVSAFKQVLKSPIIGWGLNATGHVYNLYENYTNTHNLFINTLLFGGIIGFSLLIYLFYQIVRDIKENKTYQEYLIFAVYLFALLLAAQLDKFVLYEDSIIDVMFWFYAGVLLRRKITL